MKRLLYFVMIALVISVTGCSIGAKDKPLPMSQENMEKLAKELENANRSFVPSPSQDVEELRVATYKMVIEKKLGYSFDKTFRSVFLFYDITALPFIYPVTTYIIKDPKKALDKGFISQRTFDILDTQEKAKMALTKEAEEFFGFVIECQNQNNGVCNSKGLLNVLVTHKALPGIQSSSSGEYERIDLLVLEKALLNKYQSLLDMGSANLIIKPDGTRFCTNAILLGDTAKEFIVNKNQMAISKRYAEMIDEERAALSQ
jgi:predicted component of type VI protein secretion system